MSVKCYAHGRGKHSDCPLTSSREYLIKGFDATTFVHHLEALINVGHTLDMGINLLLCMWLGKESGWFAVGLLMLGGSEFNVMLMDKEPFLTL